MRGADTFTEGLFSLKKLDDFVPGNQRVAARASRQKSCCAPCCCKFCIPSGQSAS